MQHVGPTPYRTGEDLVNRITDAAKCLAQPVDELWIYGHGGPRGLFRITSYNVCYTKLLRTWQISAPQQGITISRKGTRWVVFMADDPSAGSNGRQARGWSG